jgi:poly(3-hydroxybutyrate) depolymerase
MKTGRRMQAAAGVVAIMVLSLVAAGCGTDNVRRGDGSVVTGKINGQKEPTTGCIYHLYIPTTYNPQRSYPLVVTGHGMFPWDEAAGQRDRWVDVAERYGLIIAAPDCDSATALLGIPADRPAPELIRDEKAVLGIVKEVRSRYNINPDAIATSGWSAGAFMAHFVGTRHPEIFRMIIARCGNFNDHLIADDAALRARHMHVYCFYGESDWPGFADQSREANYWYTFHGFRNFSIKAMPGGHDPNQTEAARYLLQIVNHWPATHIDASVTEGAAPLTVTFRARVHDPDAPDGRVDSVLWDFGDKTLSAKPEVVHTFTKPGLYNVFLTVVDLDDHHEYQQAWIRVNP